MYRLYLHGSIGKDGFEVDRRAESDDMIGRIPESGLCACQNM